MAGRWSKLKGRFDETPFSSMTNARDAKFVDQVRLAKIELAKLDQKSLLAKLMEAEQLKDELERQIKDLNVELEAIGQLLKQRFEADGVNSVKTISGRTVYLEVEPYVSVDDKAEFDKFMAAHPELDYMWSVNPQTLATFVKDLLDKDLDDQVPKCLKIWLKTSVNNRKS